jgi:hypothetical protein
MASSQLRTEAFRLVAWGMSPRQATGGPQEADALVMRPYSARRGRFGLRGQGYRARKATPTAIRRKRHHRPPATGHRPPAHGSSPHSSALLLHLASFARIHLLQFHFRDHLRSHQEPARHRRASEPPGVAVRSGLALEIGGPRVDPRAEHCLQCPDRT